MALHNKYLPLNADYEALRRRIWDGPKPQQTHTAQQTRTASMQQTPAAQGSWRNQRPGGGIPYLVDIVPKGDGRLGRKPDARAPYIPSARMGRPGGGLAYAVDVQPRGDGQQAYRPDARAPYIPSARMGRPGGGLAYAVDVQPRGDGQQAYRPDARAPYIPSARMGGPGGGLAYAVDVQPRGDGQQAYRPDASGRTRAAQGGQSAQATARRWVDEVYGAAGAQGAARASARANPQEGWTPARGVSPGGPVQVEMRSERDARAPNAAQSARRYHSGETRRYIREQTQFAPMGIMDVLEVDIPASVRAQAPRADIPGRPDTPLLDAHTRLQQNRITQRDNRVAYAHAARNAEGILREREALDRWTAGKVGQALFDGRGALKVDYGQVQQALMDGVLPKGVTQDEEQSAQAMLLDAYGAAYDARKVPLPDTVQVDGKSVSTAPLRRVYGARVAPDMLDAYRVFIRENGYDTAAAPDTALYYDIAQIRRGAAGRGMTPAERRELVEEYSIQPAARWRDLDAESKGNVSTMMRFRLDPDLYRSPSDEVGRVAFTRALEGANGFAADIAGTGLFGRDAEQGLRQVQYGQRLQARTDNPAARVTGDAASALARAGLSGGLSHGIAGGAGSLLKSLGVGAGTAARVADALGRAPDIAAAYGQRRDAARRAGSDDAQQRAKGALGALSQGASDLAEDLFLRQLRDRARQLGRRR
nr:hypothetical protein [Maliibacterium massiliense]